MNSCNNFQGREGIMYKVYVVDDAVLVRKEIVLTTPWDELGCVVVGEAEDGSIALEEIIELQPDIVITDIKMTYLDGLEMIQQLREKGVEAEFIVISAYSEFEYAFHAIKLEVQDYILKPISDEELIATVLRCQERIKEKKQAKQIHISRKDDLLHEFDDKNLNTYLRKAIEYVEEHYSTEVTINEVANHLSISQSYLGKLFKTEINTTFVEFVTRIRIYKSVELLKNKNMPIYEIAERVGYKDYRYYSMIFKKMMGLTPKEYQKKS